MRFGIVVTASQAEYWEELVQPVSIISEVSASRDRRGKAEKHTAESYTFVGKKEIETR